MFYLIWLFLNTYRDRKTTSSKVNVKCIFKLMLVSSITETLGKEGSGTACDASVSLTFCNFFKKKLQQQISPEKTILDCRPSKCQHSFSFLKALTTNESL